MVGIFISILYVIYLLRVRSLTNQKKLLQQQVKRETSNILLLSEIGKELTACLSPQDICLRLYQHLNKVMDVHTFLIGVIDYEKQIINIPMYMEGNTQLPAYEISLTDTKTAAVWCVLNKLELMMT